VASSLVASMEKEWNEQILSVSSEASVFTLFEEQTCSVPLLSEAGRFYVDMKGKAGDKRFERYTSRVVSEVIGLAGDKLISAYTRHDALAFRNALLERGSANATVKRNFECVRAIWNFAAREHDVGSANPFSNMNYGNGRGSVKRKPIPIEDIRRIQSLCFDMDDEITFRIHVNRAYQTLVMLGYLVEVKKGVNAEGVKFLTRYEATNKLIDLFTDNERIELKHLSQETINSELIRIQLRDEDGNKYLADYIDTQNTIRMRDQMAYINNVLSKSAFDLFGLL
jgi:hypothetical protein